MDDKFESSGDECLDVIGGIEAGEFYFFTLPPLGYKFMKVEHRYNEECKCGNTVMLYEPIKAKEEGGE